jgi:hypothetical protein
MTSAVRVLCGGAIKLRMPDSPNITPAATPAHPPHLTMFDDMPNPPGRHPSGKGMMPPG